MGTVKAKKALNKLAKQKGISEEAVRRKLFENIGYPAP